MAETIIVRGARLHNLKNVSLTIPKNRLVVLTGVSGSGKSTLGFDILLKEGQRQYLESLGLVTFGMAKPPVDAISGLSPAVSVDQNLTNRSPRSTVGTSTEVFTYLRLLFARLGHRPCPRCGKDVPPYLDDTGADWADDVETQDSLNFVQDASLPDIGNIVPCPHCRAALPEMRMAFFSFNKPAGACPTCTGLGSVQQANLHKLVDEQKSILEGAVREWNSVLTDYHATTLKAAAAHYGFEFDLAKPLKDYTPVQRDLLFFGVESPHFRRHFPSTQPPTTVRRGRFEGIATNLLRRYADHLHAHIQEAGYRDKLEDYLVTQTCPDCEGTRLRVESRAVRLDGQTIIDLSRLPLDELGQWLEGLPKKLNAQEMKLARAILDDLEERIRRLVEVGAGYLTLERASPSLSAGESQRLRLASLLGSSLSGLLYVFDEPTIGLHARDTQRLIGVLRRLCDLGNTVLVIEHDLEMIAAADQVIDFGPGAGKHGGQVIASGTPKEIAAAPESLTGAYLSGRLSIPLPQSRRSPGDKALAIHGARHHNLQNINVQVPLGLLVAVTGASGSGKSSLVFDTLERALRQCLYAAREAPGEHECIEGLEQVQQVITIDQQQLGRLPRSNAATYTDTFTPIREAFAETDAARQRGFSSRHFSFNLPGGRCERCQGTGVLAIQMHFLPDVEVRCPACHGKRFKVETLKVKYQGYDIAQVLELTVEEALAVFEQVPAAHRRLQALCEVGLGYLQLGQPATTLSGGEAQRVKLAKELGRSAGAQALYLLDEPTTGLHLADTSRLLSVLQRLVAAGSSVIVVEHNLEVVKSADWVIDLGPEGGTGGGRLVAQGTPEQVARVEDSYTGQFLRKMM